MHGAIRTLSAILAVLCLSSMPSTAHAADDKPLIFVNSASGTGWVISTNSGLSQFAEIARSMGFRVDHGVQSNLTAEVLNGIDIYILTTPNFPFLDDDKIALRQWVRDGGILIAFDWIDHQISSFTRQFGIEYSSFSNSTNVLRLPENSPLSGPLKINSLVSNVGGVGISLLDPKKSEAILLFDNGVPAMTRTISSAGEGEVIGFGAFPIMFDDDPVTGQIKYADNEKLMKNFLSYIRKRLQLDAAYDMSVLKIKAKGGSSFNPGDQIKFAVKMKNVGTKESEEMRVALYIERTGAAPADRVEITTSTVPTLKAKKKYKLVKKTFLPDDLEPGTYEVIAVLDPDALTDDLKTGNNSATAKKQIVIQ